MTALDAPYFADGAVQARCEVVENKLLARATYRLRIDCPPIAERIMPGQFLMLRIAGSNDPLIGRPLALYDVATGTGGSSRRYVDVVYLVHGKLTSRLAELQAGQHVEAWGPLGNGFLPQACEHLIMVAGGIGYTPFLALAKEVLGTSAYGDPPREAPRAEKATLCYGARSGAYLAGIDEFQNAGIDLRLATDDGSRGHHGLVTDLLEQVLDEEADPAAARIVCCGPEPMMEAVSRIAAEHQVACQVSLETPMACGIGICFTCVAKVIGNDGHWDYKRTCVEGPVFDAAKIDWS